MLTSVIDSKVDIDVATADITNFLVHTPIGSKPGDEKSQLK